MNNKVKSIIAVVLAAATLATAGAFMTGCNKNKKDKSTSSSASSKTTTTAPATTTAKSGTTQGAAGTQAQNSAAQDQNSDAQTQTGAAQSDSAQAQNSGAQNDGYISESEAIAMVKKQAGSGATINSSYQGYTPDGLPAWVITVTPVTNGNGPATVTYYAGYQFCYAADSGSNDAGDANSGSDTYAGITQETAKNTALANMGALYTFVSALPGQAPDGSAAWVVVLRYEVGSADKTVNYYVSDSFGYSDAN